MVNADALRGKLLGKPGNVHSLGRERGEVWRYRYDNGDCFWFQVELAQKQVRSAGYAPLPECS